jgi:hypothetical protein
MQFKHPEVFYALFLLFIPIIIHLFQLRRFKKVDFTNVAFLKKATLQTRKSARLKKWLTLLTRLLALACIIIAFAQPFSTQKTNADSTPDVVLYVDNSFSMQAKGPDGTLLERAAQNLYTRLTNFETLSWFTNDQSWKNRTLTDVKTELLNLEPTHEQLTWQEVLLTANQLFEKREGKSKQLIIISDFQQREGFPEIPNNLAVTAIVPRPVSNSNVGIDTAFVSTLNASQLELHVQISAQSPSVENIPVSLYRKDDLVAKTSVDFSDNIRQEITFQIDKNTDYVGRVSLPDANLPFDNELYFSLNAPKKIQVLTINNSDSRYLDKLFDGPEFEYAKQEQSAIDYNSLASQNLIILNEMETFPVSLRTSLNAFVSNGGSLFVIPSSEANLSDYNALLGQFSLGSMESYNNTEKKITQIIFGHPLYEGVFERNITNFQYPKVQGYFRGTPTGTPILEYEDNTPFLLQKGSVYISNAPWNSGNSNFSSSPLIVPTLYNMAQQSLKLPTLYYTIGTANTFDVPLSVGQDEIIALQKENIKIVPLQQAKANYVSITTGSLLSEAGTYQATLDEQAQQSVSFNYQRDEAALTYQDPAQWQGISVQPSVGSALDALYEANAVHSYWKWFVIFALVFLLSEMLILKFLS